MEKPINIILNIPKNTHVLRICLDNNGKHLDCSINGDLKVRRGHLYYIPISEKKLNFEDGIYIQKMQNIASYINIHSIEKGQVIVEPILDYNLKHNQQIGILH
jgi:hypothetical protein